MKFEFINEAERALEEIGKITQRKTVEVVTDAMRTYEWILQEQLSGRKIVSMNGRPDDESELENFIEDKGAADAYFGIKRS
jgi:hypothetical protein